VELQRNSHSIGRDYVELSPTFTGHLPARCEVVRIVEMAFWSHSGYCPL
jgi:hypothetical protein